MLKPHHKRPRVWPSTVVAVAGSLLVACQVIIGVEMRSASPDAGPRPAARPATTDEDGGAASDAAVDAALRDGGCDLAKPFDTPSPLTSLNTVNGEFSATLSSDEREIFYTTTQPGSALVHRATRETRDVDFSAGTVVEELRDIPSPHWSVSLSADGTTLLVTAKAPPRDLYRAVRASKTAPFAPAALVSFESWSQPEEQVFASARGALYLGVQSGPQFDLFLAGLADGGGYRTPTPLLFFNTQGNESWPVESQDGFTFYYASGDGVSAEILEAKRTSLSAPFFTGATLSFPAAARKHPLWISPDGCRLYLVQDNAPGGQGGADLWVAARPP